MNGATMLFHIVLVIIATSYINAQVNPEGERINEDAFRNRYSNLSSDDVDHLVSQVEQIEDQDNVLVGFNTSTNAFISVPIPLTCEQGPITTIWKQPNTWFWPPIRVKRCRGICPNFSPCLARKTVTRNVWAVEYKRFNCWGIYKWIPISVRRICVRDETDCDCKQCSDITNYFQCVHQQRCPDSTNSNSFCYWKPFNTNTAKLSNSNLRAFSTFTDVASINTSLVAPNIWGSCDCCKETLCEEGQYFNRHLCKCVCNRVHCPKPQFQDPDTCDCVCPKDVDCGPFKTLNKCSCQCECKPFTCLPPRQANTNNCTCQCPPTHCNRPHELDPSSCQCRCPKDIVCGNGQIPNPINCRCPTDHIVSPGPALVRG